MSIHFAAAVKPGRTQACASDVRAMVARAFERVANDNFAFDSKDDVDMETSNHLLRAALRHFAVHGIGAARAARTRAEEAFFEGDRQSYDWWLSITRTLDKRLAAEAVSNAANANT